MAVGALGLTIATLLAPLSTVIGIVGAVLLGLGLRRAYRAPPQHQ